MNPTRLLFSTLCCLFTLVVNAQEMIRAAFEAEAWSVEARQYEFTTYKGKKTLYLDNGKARLRGVQLEQGIIDFDIAFSPGRKFVGVHFRSQDLKNYEEFYLRPHQSGNPDAMQYTPVINGNAGWQLYHGPGYSGAYNFLFEEWNHVRLVIAGDRMDVFINDMSQPILQVHDLKWDARSGEIGFGTFLGAAYFANLSYQPLENPPLFAAAPEPPSPAPNTITSWEVSAAFPERQLDGKYDLRSSDLASVDWTRYPVEYSGTVNLSRVSEVSEQTNTVWVRALLESDRSQTKRVDFGYSDVVRVYLNGRLLYAGQNKFVSRDYRYLGTIGYFDAVYLPLQAGANELVFAVSESGGGWGLRAKLEDMAGLKLIR